MAFLNLTAVERSMFSDLYDSAMATASPTAAMVDIFASSGLSRPTLAHIWRLTAINQNGVLIRDRFFIGMRLIALAQQNIEPTVENCRNITVVPLPAVRMSNEDPPSRIASPLPVDRNSSLAATEGSVQVPNPPAPEMAAADNEIWKVPSARRREFIQRFNTCCPTGLLTFTHAAAEIKRDAPSLSHDQILGIMRVADIDHDNHFDQVQFVAAMHLTYIASSRLSAIPAVLPELVLKSIVPAPSALSIKATVTFKENTFEVKLSDLISSKDVIWNFSNSRVGDAEVLAISKELFRSDNHFVQSLILDRNEFGYQGMTALAKMLSQNRSLSALSVAHVSNLGNSMLPLLSVLPRNSTLESLNIASIGLDDQSCDQLTSALSSNMGLKSVDVSDNCFSESSARALFEMALRHSTLLSLRLSPSNVHRYANGRDFFAKFRSLLMSSDVCISRSAGANTRTDGESTVASVRNESPKSLPSIESIVRLALDDFQRVLQTPLLTMHDISDIPSLDGADLLEAMRIQIPVCRSIRVTALVSNVNARDTLLQDMFRRSAVAASSIQRLEESITESPRSDERRQAVRDELMFRHRELQSQCYLHSNISLFAFYRHLELNICELILSAFLRQPSVTFGSATMKLSEVIIGNVFSHIPRPVSTGNADIRWISVVAESFARRVSFRYESQIMLLDPKQATLLADCAAVRVCAVLDSPIDRRHIGEPRVTLVPDMIIEALGNPELKSKFRKQSILVSGNNQKWNVESIFTKPGFAVPLLKDNSVVFDQIILDDDSFQLWTKDVVLRHEKYGFRLASQSERNYLLSSEGKPVAAVSRWLISTAESRQNRLRFFFPPSISSSCENAAGALIESSAPAPQAQIRFPSLRRFAKKMSIRGGSRSSSRPPSPAPPGSVISDLERTVEEERAKRFAAEKQLADLQAFVSRMASASSPGIPLANSKE